MSKLRSAFMTTALAVHVAGVLAQDCGSKGATKTISSPADLTSIAACTTYTGSIVISPSYTGDFVQHGLDGGIFTVLGDVSCDDCASITSFEMYWLDEVEGAIRFTNCPNLRSITNLPRGEGVGSLTLVDLPLLQSISTGIRHSKQAAVHIERTGAVNCTVTLPSYFGSDDGGAAVQYVVTRDNPNMESIEIYGRGAIVSGECIVTNSPRSAVSIGFDQADGLEVRNVAKVSTAYYSDDGIKIFGNAIIENADASELLNSIDYVKGNMSLYNVSGSFSAFSELSGINTTFKIYNDKEEITATLTELVGNFEIDIAGIIKSGADSIDFGYGEWYNSDTPRSITLRASNSDFKCCRYAYLEKYWGRDVVCIENATLPAAGNWDAWTPTFNRSAGVDLSRCTKAEDSPKYGHEVKEPSSPSSGGSSIHISPQTAQLIGEIVGPIVSAIFVAVFGYCVKRHKKKKKSLEQSPPQQHGRATEVRPPAWSMTAVVSPVKDPQPVTAQPSTAYQLHPAWTGRSNIADHQQVRSTPISPTIPAAPFSAAQPASPQISKTYRSHPAWTAPNSQATQHGESFAADPVVPVSPVSPVSPSVPFQSNNPYRQPPFGTQ